MGKQDDQPRSLIEWLGYPENPDWQGSRRLGSFVGWLLTLLVPLLFLGGVGAAFAVIWHTISNAFGDAATGPSLGAGALIAALLGAPFLIWGTVIKQRTVDFQKETHITERISKAVEQLGAEKTVKRDGEEKTVPNIEVRIGGLLSLERIAQDSTRYDKGRDHVRVMEILCAYVRENAPASKARDFPLREWKPLRRNASKEAQENHEKWQSARFRGKTVSNAREWAVSLPPPRADIALALRIIGRRSAYQRQVEARWGPEASPDAEWVFDTPCPELPEQTAGNSLETEGLQAYKHALYNWKSKFSGYSGYLPDLRNTNLQKSDLSGLTLSGTRLAGARMEGAAIVKTRMEGADLSSARMEGADLRSARLEGANLNSAQMEGMVLVRATLAGANLVKVQIEGADLVGAWMTGANLRSARMEIADLSAARMEGVDLGTARMEGADLSEARMEVARLDEALLPTSLSAAGSLRAAALRGVDLFGIALSQEQISASFGDASVTLPKGLMAPKHWPTWELPIVGDHAFDDEWREWRDDPEGYVPPPPPE